MKYELTFIRSDGEIIRTQHHKLESLMKWCDKQIRKFSFREIRIVENYKA